LTVFFKKINTVPGITTPDISAFNAIAENVAHPARGKRAPDPTVIRDREEFGEKKKHTHLFSFLHGL
jgi:hypothetical protein